MLKERRRRLASELEAAHEARLLTRQLSAQINSWNTRIAYLRGMGQGMHAREIRRPQVLDEAKRLSLAVEAARLAFRQQIESLPPELVLSSPMLDTARALDSVSVTLADAIGLISN